MHREDPVQIRTRGSAKRRSFLRSRYGKLGIELPDVALTKESIGLLNRGDARQSKLLWQPPLPGAKATLAAPPRLRGVGRDHLHSQFLHRSPHLRQSMLVHLLARLRRHEKVTAPVA